MPLCVVSNVTNHLLANIIYQLLANITESKYHFSLLLSHLKHYTGVSICRHVAKSGNKTPGLVNKRKVFGDREPGEDAEMLT